MKQIFSMSSPVQLGGIPWAFYLQNTYSENKLSTLYKFEIQIQLILKTQKIPPNNPIPRNPQPNPISRGKKNQLQKITLLGSFCVWVCVGVCVHALLGQMLVAMESRLLRLKKKTNKKS